MCEIQVPQAFREKFRVKLNSVIDDALYSENLEKGIFNYTIQESTSKNVLKKWDNRQFVCLYIDRMRSIWANLSSPEILARIRSREITPQVLAFSTHQELSPSKWKVLLDQKIKRNQSKMTDDAHATSDMFTCKKCRSKKCSHYELQTRSADEPMTIFITCLDCGKQWRQ